MQVNHINSNKVVIDEFLTVERSGSEYQVSDSRGSSKHTASRDFHYYQNGVNYLTIEQSVNRALDKMFDILDRYEYYDTGKLLTIESAVYNMIEAGYGRDDVYRLTGQIGVARHKYGYYKGVPFSIVLANIVAGNITLPTDVRS